MSIINLRCETSMVLSTITFIIQLQSGGYSRLKNKLLLLKLHPNCFLRPRIFAYYQYIWKVLVKNVWVCKKIIIDN